jgi:CheY-like chemotaxis protein
MSFPHILLVEDDEDDRFFAERTLGKAGVRSISHVATGQAAIDYLSGQGDFADREKFPLPDIILLDLKIPEISGHQVLEWIRTRPEFEAIAVYILSSSGEISDRTRAAAANAAGYFVKPLTVQNVEAVLRKFRERSPSS